MALVGYARVSSKDQSLEIQIQQLTDAGCTKIFSEQLSGVQLRNRGELEKCMNYIRDGDVLVVTRIDRLARSVIDFHKLMQELDTKQVEFRALLQPFDTTTPSGRLLRDILAAFAEFEQQVRKERQREGIEAAKAKGVYARTTGGNSKSYTPQQWAYVSRLLNNGFTYAQVAERTSINNSQIRRRFPNYNKKPWSRSKLQESRIQAPAPGEAVETVPQTVAEVATEPKTAPKKPGFMGRISGRVLRDILDA